MKKIIILIILMLNLSFLTKAQEKSNFEILQNIENQIKNKNITEQTYKDLIFLKQNVDGADAEYYLENYKDLLLNDPKRFSSFLKKNNIKLDENIIEFFKSSSIGNSLEKIVNEYFSSKFFTQNVKIEYKKIKKYYVKDNDGYVNLRKNPNVKSTILQEICNKECVAIIDSINNWYKVKYNKNIGFIHKSRVFFNDYDIEIFLNDTILLKKPMIKYKEHKKFFYEDYKNSDCVVCLLKTTNTIFISCDNINEIAFKAIYDLKGNILSYLYEGMPYNEIKGYNLLRIQLSIQEKNQNIEKFYILKQW